MNTAFLRQFPEFQEFQNLGRATQEPVPQTDSTERQTPDEQIEAALSEISTALASELYPK
jgi:restriction endonuclease Mrr